VTQCREEQYDTNKAKLAPKTEFHRKFNSKIYRIEIEEVTNYEIVTNAIKQSIRFKKGL